MASSPGKPKGQRVRAKELVFGLDAPLEREPPNASRLGVGERLSMCGQFIICSNGSWVPNPTASAGAPIRPREYAIEAAPPDKEYVRNARRRTGREDSLDSFMKRDVHPRGCSAPGHTAPSASASRIPSSRRAASSVGSRVPSFHLPQNPSLAHAQSASRGIGRKGAPLPATPALDGLDVSSAVRLQAVRMRQMGLTGRMAETRPASDRQL
mmetsp:Transcript_35334/g.67566  ORF Transcript_35334/g.67566 Transcript_35334/m.67566 type:complete len:211 (-) Transcript_35334:280-912(-)